MSINLRQAIHTELVRHPQSQLRDIFKFFFQGEFGPAHYFRDPNRAHNHLSQELKLANHFESLIWQPVGNREQFYRINLLAIKDGMITLDQLEHAFVCSVVAPAPALWDIWKRKWRLILQVLEEDLHQLADDGDDRHIIDDTLQIPFQTVHHSDVYHQAYHPHYRLINAYHFERLRFFLSS